MAQPAQITDCPTRPACPVCRMNMITIAEMHDGEGYHHCEYKCLRCGHVEVSKPAKSGG